MMVLALKFGEPPKFTLQGTFGGILLPAAVMGALLGGATHAAGTSDGKRRRWLILSPLFTHAHLVGEGRLQVVQLRTTQHFTRQLGDEIVFFN